ncbi:nuclear transport factor 2 family protein [Tateyamaria sp. ANG-S1]|uniref:nuclear transport factor 2 family protein n=1 Tax=Tateyamaria sp. ANG-S1 TaxID=1577905 RepID=UPI00057E970D|nr:nuclear transport factor 2 family protein [Tateyamaria sp. ANG-S1]KIC48168.1 polyketide cyclase [Tateyamaria sp. ANG-S1]
MSKKLIAGFSGAMASNDFTYASMWLHPDFEYYMPQTGEYLRGREGFAAMNNAYSTEGTWAFSVRSIIGDDDAVVSDVEVMDGTLEARAITFHTIKDDLILRQKEFWPDSYPAPTWRAPWRRILDAPPF